MSRLIEVSSAEAVFGARCNRGRAVALLEGRGHL